MNIFLTPLMHKATAGDFAIIERGLSRTRQSLAAQTDQDFLWVIVCNAVPNIGQCPKNVVFHIVDFPPADRDDMRTKMADKGAKLVSGLLFIRQFNPTYVYFLDADDWLNSDLNRFLNRRKTQPAGWYADAGYLADIDTRRTQKKYRLDRFCGSTFAANFSALMGLLDLDKTLDENSGKTNIVREVPWTIIENVFFSHDHDTFFRSYGLKPKKLRINAVVWVRGTGENVWVDGASRSLTSGLHLNKERLAAFGVDDQTITSTTPNTAVDYLDFFVIAFRSFAGSFFTKNTRYNPD